MHSREKKNYLNSTGGFLWQKSAASKMVDEIGEKNFWANCEAAIFWQLCAIPFRRSPKFDEIDSSVSRMRDLDKILF